MHHIRKDYDNQKHLSKLPKDKNMINCINKDQPQNRHQKQKQRRQSNKVKKQASRTKETPEQQKQRQEYDKAQKHASQKTETPKRNKIKASIMHHIRKDYDNQKHLSKLPKDENMINCINKHQPQNRHQKKKQRRQYNKVKKQASRTKETPEQQKQRQEYDKVQKHASQKNETPQKRSKDYRDC